MTEFRGKAEIELDKRIKERNAFDSQVESKTKYIKINDFLANIYRIFWITKVPFNLIFPLPLSLSPSLPFNIVT